MSELAKRAHKYAGKAVPPEGLLRADLYDAIREAFLAGAAWQQEQDDEPEPPFCTPYRAGMGHCFAPKNGVIRCAGCGIEPLPEATPRSEEKP